MKDTRPSPALLYWKRRKAGRGLGTRLPLPVVFVKLVQEEPFSKLYQVLHISMYTEITLILICSHTNFH